VQSNTIDELETSLGERIKGLRLNKNLDQLTLAARAGISVGALKNLENGLGARVRTLLCVLRALGREEWLASVAPVATINPLALPRFANVRQRATRKTASKD
jgi:transcriptional regulator with XRE-family HTH domain